jgi:PE family protein
MAVSFMVVAPESVTTAVENLAGIGSTLQEATAAATGPTTGLAAAAGDEVSAAISQLFASYGEEFQAVSNQGAAFHAEFVRLLNGSAAAYLGTDIANAAQTLANAPAQSLLGQGTQAVSAAIAGAPVAAAAVPGGAYVQLLTNTATNLQLLGSAWAADPFPFLRQFLANQLGYAQQIASSIASIPANLPNLPSAIAAAIQQALSFNAGAFAQQFIATQVGFAQTFALSLADGVTGIIAGLPQFASGVGTAFQTLLTGNYNAAISELGDAFRQLFVTGFDTSNVTLTSTGDIFPNLNLTFTGTARPTLIGPLNDFLTILKIPGQEAQFLTNLTPPSIPRQMAQNFTNVLNTLTVASIEADVVVPVFAPQTGFVSAYFGLPLVLGYALAGPPFAALNAFGASLNSFDQALATGNAVAAVSTLFDAPGSVLNGFLNGQVFVTDKFLVPTGLTDIVVQVPVIGPVTIPLPQNVSVDVHLPFDGLLVPPHFLTATVGLNGYVPPPPVTLPGIPFEATIFGTPFMGLVPLLVNYVPQQLAAAITPAAA